MWEMIAVGPLQELDLRHVRPARQYVFVRNSVPASKVVTVSRHFANQSTLGLIAADVAPISAVR